MVSTFARVPNSTVRCMNPEGGSCLQTLYPRRQRRATLRPEPQSSERPLLSKLVVLFVVFKLLDEVHVLELIRGAVEHAHQVEFESRAQPVVHLHLESQ